MALFIFIQLIIDFLYIATLFTSSGSLINIGGHLQLLHLHVYVLVLGTWSSGIVQKQYTTRLIDITNLNATKTMAYRLCLLNSRARVNASLETIAVLLATSSILGRQEAMIWIWFLFRVFILTSLIWWTDTLWTNIIYNRWLFTGFAHFEIALLLFWRLNNLKLLLVMFLFLLGLTTTLNMLLVIIYGHANFTIIFRWFIIENLGSGLLDLILLGKLCYLKRRTLLGKLISDLTLLLAIVLSLKFGHSCASLDQWLHDFEALLVLVKFFDWLSVES